MEQTAAARGGLAEGETSEASKAKAEELEALFTGLCFEEHEDLSKRTGELKKT